MGVFLYIDAPGRTDIMMASVGESGQEELETLGNLKGGNFQRLAMDLPIYKREREKNGSRDTTMLVKERGEERNGMVVL